VKFENDLVLLAEERAVLGGVIDRVNEIGRSHEIEMNVGDPR
jgi:hypothetical protein